MTSHIYGRNMITIL